MENFYGLCKQNVDSLQYLSSENLGQIIIVTFDYYFTPCKFFPPASADSHSQESE